MKKDQPMDNADKNYFEKLSKENIEFILKRYNKVNRWVIADMIRRSAYHFPDKISI